MMKIRIEGTPDELDEAVQIIRDDFFILEESKRYPNRDRSGLERIYLKVDFKRHDPFGGHRGFLIDVDGQPVHVLGDPNMPEKTREALREVARLARRAVEDGTLGSEEGKL
jgi:hypothetical protein